MKRTVIILSSCFAIGVASNAEASPVTDFFNQLWGNRAEAIDPYAPVADKGNVRISFPGATSITRHQVYQSQFYQNNQTRSLQRFTPIPVALEKRHDRQIEWHPLEGNRSTWVGFQYQQGRFIGTTESHNNPTRLSRTPNRLEWLGGFLGGQ